jgi:hypothetical protein
MKLFTPKSPIIGYNYPTNLPRDGMLFPANDDDQPDADITLALSFQREEYIAGLDVTGGRTAAIAIDNCFGCTIEGLTVDARASRHGVVIADHSDGIWLDGVLFDGEARGADIVIGWRPGVAPWSTWHRAGLVTLRDVRRSDGKPVRVHVWDADQPIVIKGNVEVRMMNPRYVRAAQWLNKRNLLP